MKINNNKKDQDGRVEYDHKTVEKKWLNRWNNGLYSSKSNYTKAEDLKSSNKNKYFCMDTFAYPSAEDVHVGYIESFGATDMIARYHRMNGYNVFYPMGYDTFGLPAENFAIKTGIHPRDLTDKSIVQFVETFRRFGLSFDGDTYLSTADESYYRWTQWLFIQLYKKGLAYRKKSEVNWCPSCQTVIANEQVIDDNICERCKGEIEQKKLTQWFFKVTAYADKLDAGIEQQNWPESGKKIHKNWIGKKTVKGKDKYRLHDWCISRQRYWGTPIPIVYCKKCGEQPIPESDLPVVLPYDVDFMPGGKIPLMRSKDFHEGGRCPKCGGKAKRETDVMDTFVSSAWYMFKYFDPTNDNEIFDKEKVKGWLPLDWYQGAREHYTAHLIYARFVAMFLFDIGFIDNSEPFINYIPCGLIVSKGGSKFSKRLANAPDTQGELERYGADTLRIFMQFVAPFDQNAPYDTDMISGISRFLRRMHRITTENVNGEKHEVTDKSKRAFNKAIIAINRSFTDYKWNVAISRIMDLVNEVNKVEFVDIDIWKDIIKMIAPFAPFIAEELWEIVGEKDSVHIQSYPVPFENIEKTKKTVAITINGKKRATIQVEDGNNEKEILLCAIDQVSSYGVNSGTKYVYVEGKVINFIISSK